MSNTPTPPSRFLIAKGDEGAASADGKTTAAKQTAIWTNVTRAIVLMALLVLDYCGEKLRTGYKSRKKVVSTVHFCAFYDSHYVGWSDFVAVARVVWIITSRGEERVGIRGDTRFTKRGRMPERLGGIHFTCRTAHRKCQVFIRARL